MRFLLKLLNLASLSPDDGGRGQVVIGQGVTDAREAERRHRLSHPDVTSPMPADRFKEWRGDYDLFDLEPLPLDAEIRSVCRDFREASTQEQCVMRDGMSMDDFYTLLTFGRRASVQAIRSEDTSIADDGLTAIAMVDMSRIDHRDATMSLGLLDHALQRLGAIANERIEEASRQALPEIAEVLLRQTKRPASHRRLAACCYEEFESRRGIGFVRRGVQGYAPLSDLFPVAVDIKTFINSDCYRSNIELASSLPPVWLQGHDNAVVSKALESVTGGVTIDGRILPEKDSDPFAQQLTVFLIETGSEAFANELLAISEVHAAWHLRLGAASGNLFALMVARSVREGVDAFETAESLQRFKAPLQHALDRRNS
ncbi:MAG: hypothetical protein AAFO01_04835 [Pseudomonadota bacterium]